MSRIGDLEREISERSHELNALKAEQADQRNAALVGKCFKYRNSYSCPGPDDYWWMYAQVLRAKDGSLRALRFQTDRDGKVEVEPDAYFSCSENYKSITLMEFAEAWAAMLRRLDGIVVS